MKNTMKTIILHDARPLSVPGVANLCVTGAEIEKTATADEIISLAKSVAAAARATDFWAADVCEAARGLSDDAAQLTLEALGFSFAETTRALAVASIPRADRDARLSAQAHALIAKRVEDPAERRRWIQIAAEEGLGMYDLAASLEAGEVRRTQDARGAQIYSASAVTTALSRWVRQCGSADPETWSSSQKAAALEELAPVEEFLQKLHRAMAPTFNL